MAAMAAHRSGGGISEEISASEKSAK